MTCGSAWFALWPNDLTSGLLSGLFPGSHLVVCAPWAISLFDLLRARLLHFWFHSGLLCTRCLDRCLHVVRFFWWRQYGGHSQTLDPKLSSPARGVIKMF